MQYRYGTPPFVPYTQYPVAEHPFAQPCSPKKGFTGRGGLFEGPTLNDMNNVCGARTGQNQVVPNRAWSPDGQIGFSTLSQMPMKAWSPDGRIGFGPQRPLVPFSPNGLTIGMGAVPSAISAPAARQPVRDWLRRVFFKPCPVQPTAPAELTPKPVVPTETLKGQAIAQPPGMNPLDAQYLMDNRSNPAWGAPLTNDTNWTPRGGILDGSTLQGGIQDGQPVEAAFYDATKPKTVGTGVSVETLPNAINDSKSVPFFNTTPGMPMAGFGRNPDWPGNYYKRMNGLGATRPEAIPRPIGHTGGSERARRPLVLGASSFWGSVYGNGGTRHDVPTMNITPPLRPISGFGNWSQNAQAWQSRYRGPYRRQAVTGLGSVVDKVGAFIKGLLPRGAITQPGGHRYMPRTIRPYGAYSTMREADGSIFQGIGVNQLREPSPGSPMGAGPDGIGSLWGFGRYR